jgi:hypothetical protein
MAAAFDGAGGDDFFAMLAAAKAARVATADEHGPTGDEGSTDLVAMLQRASRGLDRQRSQSVVVSPLRGATSAASAATPQATAPAPPAPGSATPVASAPARRGGLLDRLAGRRKPAASAPPAPQPPVGPACSFYSDTRALWTQTPADHRASNTAPGRAPPPAWIVLSQPDAWVAETAADAAAVAADKDRTLVDGFEELDAAARFYTREFLLEGSVIWGLVVFVVFCVAGKKSSSSSSV